MIKIYNKHTQSQDKPIRILSESTDPLRDIFQTVESIRDNSDYIAIFDVLLNFQNNNRNIYAAQETIAQLAGCARATVNRAIKFFKEKGWLWTQRRMNSSLIYFIDPIFRKEDIRRRLVYIFKSCMRVMATLLVVSVNAAGHALPETVTLLFNKEYVIAPLKNLPDYHQWWKEGRAQEKRFFKEQVILKRVGGEVLKSSPAKDGQEKALQTAALAFAQAIEGYDCSNETILKKGMMMSNRPIVDRVLSMIPEISESDLFKLDAYDENQIERALKRVERRNPEAPAPYLFGVLRGIHEDDQKSGRGRATETRKVVSQAALNDRYTADQIEHCEKILALFVKIAAEDPEEADKIEQGKPSTRWSGSWGTPESFERRLKKLKGI